MTPPFALRTLFPLLAAATLTTPSALALLRQIGAPAFAAVAGAIAVLAHVLLYTLLFVSVAYAVFKVPARWSPSVKLTAFLGVGVATFAAAMLLTLLPYLLSAFVCYGAKLCSLSLFAEQLTNALFMSGVQITVLHGLLVCPCVVGGLVLLRRVV